MPLSKLEFIDQTRIHPLGLTVVKSTKSLGMCIPPQLYYCLTVFTYNRQRIEVYYVSRDELGKKPNELLGKMFCLYQQETWVDRSYFITDYENIINITEWPLWDHPELHQPDYIELQEFIDQCEEETAFKDEQHEVLSSNSDYS